jgi:hypothetical protein
VSVAQLGIGTALAVLIDATIVRALLVPDEAPRRLAFRRFPLPAVPSTLVDERALIN